MWQADLIGRYAKTAATDDEAARAWADAWDWAVLEVPILRPGRGGVRRRAGRARN